MNVEQSLIFLDRYVSRRWRMLPATSQCTLTYTEFDYLETLYELKSTRLSDFAEIMCVSKPTASNMIHRLERKGLVTRSACLKDGRVVNLGLSQKGQDFLDKNREIFGSFIAEVFNCLLPEDQQDLEQLLAKMVSGTVQKK